MESVEDEWEREMDSDEDLDLLFVKYNPDGVTIEKLKEVVVLHEFQVEVKVE